MAQPLRPAVLEGLPDGRHAERLAGVDRDVEVLVADEVERLEVPRRREALLRPGDIEADRALIAPADRRLRDLDRTGELAHPGHEHLHDDRVARLGGARRADPEPLEVRVDHLVERQPQARRELGRVSDLGIDDPVRGEILGAFGGDPDDRVTVLEDADRVLERLEVELERFPIRATGEPGGEVVGVGRRQGVVAVFRGEIDDGPWPQATVEVIVEHDLGRRPDRIESQHRSLRGASCGDGIAGRLAPTG